MLLVKTFVAASAVEGVGVFAGEPIAKGTIIWRFDPLLDLLVPLETYKNASPPLQNLLDRYSYPSPDRPGFLVYEADNGRFMNHAEEPNTDFSGDRSGIASRDIAFGEEITCDYNQFHDDFELLPNPVDER